MIRYNSIMQTFKNVFSLVYGFALVYFVCLSIWGLYIRYSETLHDGDIYFSMAYGRQYFQDQTLKIDENQFRWQDYCKNCKTSGGLYPSWIPHIIFYLAFKAMGYTGLYLVRFFIISIIFILFFMMARQLKILEFSGLFLMLLFITFSMSITGLMLKADLFSVLWMSIEAFILFNYMKKPSKKILFLFPILFLLWANSHISVIVGLGIFSWWSLLTLVFDYKNRDKQILFLVSLFSWVVIFLTPKPLFLLAHIKGNFLSFFIKRIFFSVRTSLGKTKSYILAFDSMKISFKNILFLWMLALSSIFFSLMLVQAIRDKQKFKSKESLLFLFIFLTPISIFAVKLARMSYMFSIFSLFSVCWAIYKVKPFLKRAISFINVLSLVILYFFILHNLFIYRERSGLIGPGAWTPVLETEYIRSHIPSGENIFTTLSAGSYMMWKGYPDYRNYMDSRMGSRLPDYIELVSGRFSKMKEPLNWRAFDVALVSFKEWPLMLHGFIRKREEWKPVFWAQEGVVFVRKEAFPELRWTNPDFEKLSRYVRWPYFTSRIIMFLLIEGHVNEAKAFLKLTKITMPEWYRFSYKSWELVFSMFESSDIISALYNNIVKIEALPLTIKEVVLYLSREYERILFNRAMYKEAYVLEVLLFRFVVDIPASLYNQGIIKWQLGDTKQAKRLLMSYKKNVQIRTDEQQHALELVEGLLGGKQIRLTEDDLF